MSTRKSGLLCSATFDWILIPIFLSKYKGDLIATKNPYTGTLYQPPSWKLIYCNQYMYMYPFGFEVPLSVISPPPYLNLDIRLISCEVYPGHQRSFLPPVVAPMCVLSRTIKSLLRDVVISLPFIHGQLFCCSTLVRLIAISFTFIY